MEANRGRIVRSGFREWGLIALRTHCGRREGDCEKRTQFLREGDFAHRRHGWLRGFDGGGVDFAERILGNGGGLRFEPTAGGARVIVEK
jgi:hypothetical protein